MKLSPICQTLIHSKSNPLSPVIQNIKKHSVHSIENEKKDNNNQLELRINQLVEENKKVNLQLNDKIKENEQLRGQIMEQEIQINKLKGIEHELILVKEISDIRFQDYEKSKLQAEHLYQELTDIQSVFQDSSNKLMQQSEEIQQWKIRYAELDSTRLQQMQELKQKVLQQQEEDEQKQSFLKVITEMEKTIISLQDQLKQKDDSLKLANDDLNQWKIKYSKVQVQQKQLANDKEKDQKIQMLIDEIERLNDLLGQRNDEIYTLKRLAEKTAQLISISQRAQRSASGQKYK
ncbi:unnamed protein product (macronuclear) [Paramecium tetraurelia]|uniref:Uncharacterized protein n=1 Tax=Paramecium tetraurelia TaxID=5888 RepID=A0CR53_PARTE|nr:uncharacterized protein GSPATT00009584001 [Paramecium tetraurelia]CAK73270.1 unnamed protein product [Paramecium tetraurelia]|eukprot:XP_001440667.1 hypothetical protein (macronuclear) [Paramecium tetraurelia strain d4-2]